jgi:hypothetical protein
MRFVSLGLRSVDLMHRRCRSRCYFEGDCHLDHRCMIVVRCVRWCCDFFGLGCGVSRIGKSDEDRL